MSGENPEKRKKINIAELKFGQDDWEYIGEKEHAFYAAVEISKVMLQDKEMLKSTMAWDDARRRKFQNSGLVKHQITHDVFIELLKNSQNSGNDAEALKRNIAYAFLHNVDTKNMENITPIDIPDEIYYWLVDYLRGYVELPRQTGRIKNRGREYVIAEQVYIIAKKFGFPVSRNVATENENSACDAVARALRELKLRPSSYERVRDIYFYRMGGL